MINSNQQNQSNTSNLKQSNEDNQDDNQLYQSSDSENSFKAPQKNQISAAIFNKYNKYDQIQQVEENQKESLLNEPNSDSHKKRVSFKIKNLDTGEQQQIFQQDEEQEVATRITKGVSMLSNASNNKWNQFWANVNFNNQKFRYFCQNGFYDEANKMIHSGQNDYPVQLDKKGLDDWTPLHYACYQGHQDIAQLLLQNGADVNALTKFKRNSLHIATLRGYLNVAKILYKFKINFDAADLDGNTALHFAAEGGYKEIIQYLLSIYCAVKKNRQGKTPIDDCCDDSLKQVFIQYGFKQSGNYQQFKQAVQLKSTDIPKNKLEHVIVPRQNLTPEDFIYYKLLGKGSFGQVFLVKKKNDSTGKLYAMKVLSKDKVMTKNLKRYALTQRNVMSVINHPFMAKLFFAFQTTGKLFLVMDYYPGGDLGKLISKKKNIPQLQARKYICQLTLAFQALHKNMIVFRDLKPDNVVLDSQGHCRLTDFGLSKQGIYNNTTQSFCGSVAYLAPQILTKQGHSRTVDWYLLGLVLYQLVVGLPPYYNSKKQVLFQNIKRGPLKIPKSMSENAKDLIKRLLCRDPRKRLGANKDSEQIKQHPFFQGINWQEVFNRKLQMPPIDLPKINLNETIKVTFMQNQNGKKIQGWTFINKI